MATVFRILRGTLANRMDLTYQESSGLVKTAHGLWSQTDRRIWVKIPALCVCH